MLRMGETDTAEEKEGGASVEGGKGGKKMRSFRGCRNCKISKRRCSEDKPVCASCAKAGRRCEVWSSLC